MSVAAVILAAGASTRLGRPKQTLRLAGELLIERAVRLAQEAGLAPVFVVVRDHSLDAVIQQSAARMVLNRRADEGMATSIAAGVRALGDEDDCIVLACDQIGLRAEHLRLLCAERTRRCGSAYAGRVGIPAYFPASDAAALVTLEGDRGARALLAGSRSIVAEELALDLDTADDVRRAAALYGPLT